MGDHKILYMDDASAQIGASAMRMCDFVKHMQDMGMKIDTPKFLAMLKSDGLIEKSGGNVDQPTKAAFDMGLMCVEESVSLSNFSSTAVSYTTLVTAYGQKHLIEMYAPKIPKKKVMPFPRRYITRQRVKKAGDNL